MDFVDFLWFVECMKPDERQEERYERILEEVKRQSKYEEDVKDIGL